VPEDRFAEGFVTRVELAELARLFDEFQNSFDPASVESERAEAEFNNRVKQLFDERVAEKYQSVSETLFRAKIRTWCRKYLRNCGT